MQQRADVPMNGAATFGQRTTLLGCLLVFALSSDLGRSADLDRATFGAERASEVSKGGFVPHPAPPKVVVVRVRTSDNGDGDGVADTNETIEMKLDLYNRTGQDLTGVVARLSTDDPKVACISRPTLIVGALADRETRTTEGAFTFVVADVNRGSVVEDFSVSFQIEISSDQLGVSEEREVVDLDLDLEFSGGALATTFFEGFESGFGAFTTMHLDRDLNPPDTDLGNDQAGFVNSQGYRCQYDTPGPGAQGPSSCYAGAHGRPDAFYFQSTDDRAFSGAGSLHFGVFLDAALGFTTPNAALQAVATEEPLNLGWGSVCSLTRSLACVEDLGCPVGESCVEVEPVLTIKHQISQVDHRLGVVGQASTDGVQRAVVQIQRADPEGNPIGFWQNLAAHRNAYDTADFVGFINCTFDPVDDGNDENHFFPGSTRRGPSSTCNPVRTFVHQGDTLEFGPGNLGDASDGPGLEGEAGVGTWVESAFDLSAYRGQRVRLRFLESTLESGPNATIEDLFGINPHVGDDGWFIDHVTLTDTLTHPATAGVDDNENLDIKQDTDFDGIGAVCDCAADDETAWEIPGAIRNLRLSHSGGSGGTTTLSWQEPAFLGGTAVRYDTVRSATPDDFSGSGVCVEAGDGNDTVAIDVTLPDAGTFHGFLVRAEHACGPGSAGATSSGEARVVRACL